MRIIDYFTQNLTLRQKQYEAVRAVAFEEGDIKDIAARYEYSPGSLRVLISKVLTGQHILFPQVKRGPRKRRIATEIPEMIYKLRRKERLNGQEITRQLNRDHISISVRTVERILTDAGFPRLRRRSYREMGISKKGSVVPARSQNTNLSQLESFRADCQVARAFFFLPYILESGIMDLVEKIPLAGSNDVGCRQAALSLLLLKLIGKERLSGHPEKEV